MKKKFFLALVVVLTVAAIAACFVACDKSDDKVSDEDMALYNEYKAKLEDAGYTVTTMDSGSMSGGVVSPEGLDYSWGLTAFNDKGDIASIVKFASQDAADEYKSLMLGMVNSQLDPDHQLSTWEELEAAMSSSYMSYTCEGTLFVAASDGAREVLFGL